MLQGLVLIFSFSLNYCSPWATPCATCAKWKWKWNFSISYYNWLIPSLSSSSWCVVNVCCDRCLFLLYVLYVNSGRCCKRASCTVSSPWMNNGWWWIRGGVHGLLHQCQTPPTVHKWLSLHPVFIKCKRMALPWPSSWAMWTNMCNITGCTVYNAISYSTWLLNHSFLYNVLMVMISQHLYFYLI